MTNFDTSNLLNHNIHKGCFSTSEESIINQFTKNKTGNCSQEYVMNQFSEMKNKETNDEKQTNNIFASRTILYQDNDQFENINTNTNININTNISTNTNTNIKCEGGEKNLSNYSKEHLLNKIRNLENEKKYLLKFLEDKKNQEIEYKQALETQVAIMNSENKKNEFYEKEWLKMRSLEYYLINSGKAPLRHLLEKHYKDSNIYEKIGNLSRTQEAFVANLIKDHKKLIKEKNSITKKYHDAVDSNFQLYQQNEMLKAQNMCLLDNDKNKINQELENKLSALNASLMHVQKENIEMREILDQYSRLITNIKHCSEMSDVMNELKKFENYITI